MLRIRRCKGKVVTIVKEEKEKEFFLHTTSISHDLSGNKSSIALTYKGENVTIWVFKIYKKDVDIRVLGFTLDTETDRRIIGVRSPSLDDAHLRRVVYKVTEWLEENVSYFNGSIDEVGVWNRSLSPEEVERSLRNDREN